MRVVLEKLAIENVDSPNWRAEEASSTRRRITYSLRRNASAPTPRPRATKSWRMTGSLSRASRPDVGAVDRHVAPADRHLPLLVRDADEQLLADQLLGRIAREEAHRDGVLAGRRKLGVDLLARPAPQEGVGQLQEESGTVSGLGIGACCAAMLHLAEHLEAHLHDRVIGLAGDAHDEAEATGCVVVARVVQRVRAHVGHGMRIPSCRSVWIDVRDIY